MMGPRQSASLEESLLALAPEQAQPSPVFILGSPRTGSTLLYQLVVHGLGLPYIANLTNELFWSRPIVGLALQRGVRAPASLESSFGKTRGLFSPSEASAVMKAWCGGGHPSQVRSSQVLEGSKEHMRRTLASVEALYDGRPIVIKNAWNCFRVRSLAQTLPASRFVWIRRDQRHAAASDLAARRETKDSEMTWNSATPANVDELRSLSPEAQVLENQYEFNRAIEDGLSTVATLRREEVWYEDLLASPTECLERISSMLGAPQGACFDAAHLAGIRPGLPRETDLARVEVYFLRHRDRLSRFLRPCSRSEPCGG